MKSALVTLMFFFATALYLPASFADSDDSDDSDSGGSRSTSVTVSSGGGAVSLPEPATLGLVAAGFAGIVLLRRRRK